MTKNELVKRLKALGFKEFESKRSSLKAKRTGENLHCFHSSDGSWSLTIYLTKGCSKCGAVGVRKYGDIDTVWLANRTCHNCL